MGASVNPTATTRLLDALRASIEPQTDYRVAKLLAVTRSTVSAWRTRKGHMSMANIARACELAGIPEQTWEWELRIGAEREQGPDGDVYRSAVKDLESVKAGREPSPVGLFAMLRAGSRAAAIMALAFFAGISLFPEKPASAAPLPQGASAGSLNIMLHRMHRRRRRRWLTFTWFPIATLRLAGPELAL